MAAHIKSKQTSALRGPLLSSTYNPRFPDVNDSFVYIKDALIILDGDKILEFGPAESLKHELEEIKLIKLSQKCRIIKSIVHS